MAKFSWSDEIGFIGHVLGFWLFIFSEDYRTSWIKEFSQASFSGKLIDIAEAIFSILVGLILPVYLIFTQFN